MVGKRTILLNDKEVAIRSYEVSIWTLQDSFITILKWANLENKGQIQKPKVVIDSDGTENFSFSIPMYLHPEEENPIWYNTLNGNLMIGMRKIKVILNKTLEEEKVFEFLITKVKERHEKDELYCDVECEGLTFHELGKIGYKIALSQDDFLVKYEQWFTKEKDENDNLLVPNEPHQTINYWNEEFLELEYATENQIPNKWYYKVEMNWDSYNSNLNRDSDKIYEDDYVASWELADGQLIPSRVEVAREKERPVEISESNIYNITQKIAESFGVFCRYEYGYDANYHIISRTIVYYNNFIEEEKGHMDLTYPYHTSEITREMDSTELTTKLFVRPVDYDYSETGQVTIMSVDANKSREDYILNFEYLHKFNIITDEQYAAIADYEKTIRFINLVLEDLERRIIYLENKEIELKAKDTLLQNSNEEASTQINNAADHITNLLDDETGVISVEGANAKALIIKNDNNKYYVTMPFVGIIPESIALYKTFSYSNNGVSLSDRVKTGSVQLDSMTGDVTQIVWSNPITLNNAEINTIWMTCKYVPDTYWTTVKQYWEKAKNNINEEKIKNTEQLQNIIQSLEAHRQQQEDLLKQQKAIRKEFEEMMGPALREGYWQPENYNDYGDKYTNTFTQNNQTFDLATYKFDTVDYDNDSKLTYYEGQDEKTYFVAILDNLNYTSNEYSSWLEYIKENYDNLSFIYCDQQIIELNQEIEEVDPSNSQVAAYVRDIKKSIRIGAGCRFGFVNYNSSIKPALIIEDSKLMTDDQIAFLKTSNNSYPMYLGVLNTNIEDIVNGGTTITKIISTIDSNAIQLNPLINSGISEVHPRIIIDSLLLKHATKEDLLIKFGDEMLTEYVDYSVIIESYVNDWERVWKDQYFINFKPEAYFKRGVISPSVSINYSLSNADLMIYLDALQVSKENASPKVSYTIKLSMYDPYIIHDIYNKMLKIVHINDNQLKFENVQGYISHIEMMLDTPWEDSIEVKNYKTKFEDLFSNIVAQTSAMEKKSASYDVAAAAFGADGTLTATAINKMLDSNSLIFNTYFDEYLSENDTLKNILTNVFDEAGQVLSSAGNALADIKTLTYENAGILSGFVRGAEDGFARGIDLISSDSTYTSAVQINRDGIFIGSDQRIALYSGIIGNESGGVSIDLNPYRLILGASSASNATAAKFTDKYLVLATGDIITNSENNTINLDTLTVNGTINGLVGAKFTSNSFGLATLSQNVLNAILMNDKGITIGSSNIDRINNQTGQNLDQDTATLRATNGSYVRIAGTGIDIGSGANLYAHTNNLIIDSEATNTNSIFELKKINNNTTETALKYSITNGLEIKGAITATAFTLGDNVTIDASKIVNLPEGLTQGDLKKVTVTSTGLSWGDTLGTGESALVVGSQGSLQIAANGNLTIANNGNFTINSGGNVTITSSNLVINTNAGNNSSIFQLKNGTTDYFKIEKDGNGTISATLGGWSILGNKLYSGSGTSYVALDANTSDTYAIWCGNTTDTNAPFRVKRNGSVYLNSLMVLDERTRTSTSDNWGNWVIDNTATHENVTTSADGLSQTGYVPIDFSKLNFNSAISLSLSVDGSQLKANANLWGRFHQALSKTVSISGSVRNITVTGSNFGQGIGDVYVQVGDLGTITCTGVSINGEALTRNGFESAVSDINNNYAGKAELDTTNKKVINILKSVSSSYGGNGMSITPIYDEIDVSGISGNYEEGKAQGWSDAYSKISSTKSNTVVSWTYPSPTYGGQAGYSYFITGYQAYDKAGLEVQVVGTTNRFTIPSNTFVGSPYLDGGPTV